jgi:hypothetical protein
METKQKGVAARRRIVFLAGAVVAGLAAAMAPVGNWWEGYYALLRWFCTFAFLLLAFWTYRLLRSWLWAVLLAAGAVVFNPLEFKFSREVWIAADIFFILLLGALCFFVLRREAPAENKHASENFNDGDGAQKSEEIRKEEKEERR